MSNTFLQTVELKPLNISDAPEIANLEAKCFSMPWSEQQCKAAFLQKHYVAFGLKQNKNPHTLLGYISIYQVLDEVEILNIGILPNFRRQGLGQYLLINTLQAAAKMGMNSAVLEVRQSNVAARTLYEGAGFELVGKRPKYYADTGEDALIYRLILI